VVLEWDDNPCDCDIVQRFSTAREKSCEMVNLWWGMQVEIEATKQEVEHMVELFKSEIESVSRIAAGGLKLLQLHGTIGQNAIDQLSYFGKQNFT
jgi:hypothetical protein